jgi:transposase InsO family protein
MTADDVKQTLDDALVKTGINLVKVVHRPRLLSDNGPCYLSDNLRQYLGHHGIEHTRSAPYHPMTQGKIERYHRSMKNIIKLQNYYLPSELEYEIKQFVEYYNNERYHESINNLTPADVYNGNDRKILTRRNKIKRETLKLRKYHNLKKYEELIT